MEKPPWFVSTYSRDNVDIAADGRLFSPSFEKNGAPISEVLERLLGDLTGTVLEIGSGTGQHAALFSARLPGLRWLPSDFQDDHLASIAAWRAHAGIATLLEPVRVDALTPWEDSAAVQDAAPFDAVYAMNVLHIAPWAVAEGIVRGAARVLAKGGALIFYGPFREGGEHTGEGNARFDASLRAQEPAWGIRDLDEVAGVGCRGGLRPGRDDRDAVEQPPGAVPPYSTVTVIRSDMIGGLCGMWLQSASTSCRVCVPAGSSSVTSV